MIRMYISIHELFDKFSISLKKLQGYFFPPSSSFILFLYKSPSPFSSKDHTHPLYQKCHRYATSIIRGNRINPQTDRPGHRLISVTYVDAQTRSNSSRIRHAYLARFGNVYLRESHRSQAVSGYNVVSRVIIQSKRDPRVADR